MRWYIGAFLVSLAFWTIVKSLDPATYQDHLPLLILVNFFGIAWGSVWENRYQKKQRTGK